MSVLFGVSDDENYFDRGRPRSVRDTMIMLGCEPVFSSSLAISVCKMMCGIRGNGTVTEADVIATQNEHKREFLSTMIMCGNTSTRNGHVNTKRAPIALAVYYALLNGFSEERISKFVESLRTGIYDGKTESSVAVLRNDIIAAPRDRGRDDQRRILSMTERAIVDYMNGVERKKTYSCAEVKPYIKTDDRVKKGE